MNKRNIITTLWTTKR